MKTIAIIPCHNEAKHIAAVVEKAKQHVDSVWVIDDHSIDTTVLKAIVAGAGVITHIKGKGAGSAIREGILLMKKYEQPDIIVMLDGDGQHDADEIPRLLKPLYSYADVSMGIRIDGNMPKYRRFGNKILSWFCNIGSDIRPKDSLTGFWAISVLNIPELTEDGWGWAVELFIKVRKQSIMTTVPIKAIYHNRYSDNSSKSPLWLGLVLLWMIIKWRLKVEVFKR